MKNKRIFLFIGTTAELIKLVPVIRELSNRKIKFSIIASGQNDIHFEEFAEEIGNIKISYAVTPKDKNTSLFLFVVWAIRTFFSLLKGMKGNFKGLNKTNSLFIVHGDTVSSLMGALVASVYKLKLVHIESGLRSYDFFEPFPEEICRFIISKIADVHFCPNAWAVNNLRSLHGEKINTYENTLIETFLHVMSIPCSHPLVNQLKKDKTKYFVLVVHRQEHILFNKGKTSEIIKFLLNVTNQRLRCIFLVHDLSSDFIRSVSSVIPSEIAYNITRVSRLAYGDFMHLLESSEFLVTDGGSNQEEMYYMGKPCLLLRDKSERIEGIGKNVVLSKNGKKTIARFLNTYKEYKKKPVNMEIPPSKIIVDYLIKNES